MGGGSSRTRFRDRGRREKTIVREKGRGKRREKVWGWSVVYGLSTVRREYRVHLYTRGLKQHPCLQSRPICSSTMFAFFSSSLLYSLLYSLFSSTVILYSTAILLTGLWSRRSTTHFSGVICTPYVVAIAGHGVIMGVEVLLKKEILQDVKSRE